MKNRNETLNWIMTLVLYGRDKTIVVALPTFADVKDFKQELKNKILEIPEWLLPELKVDTIRQVDFANGMKIMMGQSARSMKGITPSALFADSRLMNDAEWKEYMTFVTLVFTKNPTDYFDNV